MSIESGRAGTNIPKVDEWRDGMVEQVSEYMDKIKDLDAKEAVGADTVLEEEFESIGDNATDAVMGMLDVYTRSDTSGRSAIAEVFHALTGVSFDYFLTQASDACQQTLCLVEDESLDDLMEQKVEDYRAGRLETYSIDEVRAHCGLSNDER